MLNRFRKRLEPKLEKIGCAFAATGLGPNFWTGLGLALAFASAIAYGTGMWYAALAGGMLLLVSGFFDVIDGQVARLTGRASPRGAFLDSIFDKIAEVAIFAGILAGGLGDPLLVAVAMGVSLLVSYSRARAESLGVQLQGIGIGERAERLLVIALVGMALMDLAMIIVIIIASVTLVQRITTVWKGTRD